MREIAAAPGPPFLMVRAERAFWVQREPLERTSATLQAFREGFWEGARCYDRRGALWPVLGAELVRRPSVLQRVLPSLRVAVRLDVGPPQNPDLPIMVRQLASVLRSGNEFCDHLRIRPEELLSLFEHAQSAEEVIRLAERHGG